MYAALVCLFGVSLLSLSRAARAAPSGAAEETTVAPAVFRGDDLLLLPIRVHLLQAKEAPELQCGLTDTDVRRVMGKVQAIWRGAGIHFYVESIVRETAVNQLTLGTREDPWNLEALLEVRPPSSRAEGVLHVYYLHEMVPNGVWLQDAIFVKDAAELLEVEDGCDEPLPRVTAHELGHALGLRHRQNRTNLMASGTTGMALNREEIARARAQALLALGAQRPAETLATAASLSRKGDRPAALRLYSLLATLPGDCDAKRRASSRLQEKENPRH